MDSQATFMLVHANRPRSGRGTAQPPSLAGPEAVTGPKPNIDTGGEFVSVVGVQVSPFADAPILPRFALASFPRPGFSPVNWTEFDRKPFVSKSLPKPCVSSLDD